MRLYLQHNWYIKKYSIGIYFLPIILSNDKLHPLFPHLNSALVLVEILRYRVEKGHTAILHCAGSSVYW